MTLGEFHVEYEAAAHAMQSAVAMEIAHETGLRDSDPVLRALKHLRVGVNSAMSSQGALADLLVNKGVITDEEYRDAVLAAMRHEAERCARETRKRLGLPDNVTFG